MSNQYGLTQEQVAEMFGVTIHAVRKWRAAGKISYFRVGRTIRFTASDVQDFIERHSHEPKVAEPVA